MRVNLEGGCLVAQMKEGFPLRRGNLKHWRLFGRESGTKAISLSVFEVERGVSPGLRNGECDEALFLLAGRATVILDGEPHEVEHDAGVFVRRGVCLTVENPSPDPVMLLASQCPDPGAAPRFEEPCREAAGAAGSLPSPIARFEDQPVEAAQDGRSFRVLVGPKTGSDQVTQFVGFIPPGRAPEHFHEYEEVLCILEGDGRMWSGETSTPVGPGSCVFLPRRQVHCLENTGSSDLKLCGLFYPAGSPAIRYHPGGINLPS